MIRRAYGLRLRSEIQLPELPTASGEEADAEIALGQFESASGPGFTVVGDTATLVVPDVARFRITGGRSIVVAPAQGGSERNIRLFLLGSALGALLHQRGILPLHANAIAAEGQVVAFLGASGTGKSTLAGWFRGQNCPILSDDVCAVTREDGRPMVHPGIPRLRLWQSALEVLGRGSGGLQPSFDGAGKFDLPDPGAPEVAMPLARLYWLRRTDAPALRIEPLNGSEALAAIVRNTYRGGFVGLAGLAARHMDLSIELAKQVPVFAVDRGWGFDWFGEQACELQAHILAGSRSAPAPLSRSSR